MDKMMEEIEHPREAGTMITQQMEAETNIQDMTAMMMETVDTDPTNMEDEVLIEAVSTKGDVVVLGAAEDVVEVVTGVMGEGTKKQLHPLK